jgi:hypothetical protein
MIEPTYALPLVSCNRWVDRINGRVAWNIFKAGVFDTSSVFMSGLTCPFIKLLSLNVIFTSPPKRQKTTYHVDKDIKIFGLLMKLLDRIPEVRNQLHNEIMQFQFL